MIVKIYQIFISIYNMMVGLLVVNSHPQPLYAKWPYDDRMGGGGYPDTFDWKHVFMFHG